MWNECKNNIPINHHLIFYCNIIFFFDKHYYPFLLGNIVERHIKHVKYNKFKYLVNAIVVSTNNI